MEERLLFEKYDEGKHWESHPTIYAEEFFNFLKESKFSGKLIDLGCGNGRDINFFSKAGISSIGVDYSERDINSAEDAFPNCKFENGNIENLNFSDDSFSAAFMINVIHYVKKQEAIDEVFRILKNGGYFYIHFNLSIIDKNGVVDYSDSEEKIIKLLSRFKIIKGEVFERIDTIPKKHTHKIFKLILKKNE